MEAKQALAFAARRQGTQSMDEVRWRHVLSLELGWMPPGQAARYVAACRTAGLLVEEEGLLRLAFDAHAVVVPRGFRPDPAVLPTGAPPAQIPAVAAEAPSPGAPAAPADLFQAWLPRVAAARGEDVAATLQAVERQQEASGGLLHAEPALLRLGAEAGLDVREAAAEALSRLRA